MPDFHFMPGRAFYGKEADASPSTFGRQSEATGENRSWIGSKPELDRK